MERITLERDNARDVTFVGELIAEAASSPDRASHDYSGAVGRWTELRMFRTKGGKFVCQRTSYTQWQGETDQHEVHIVSEKDAAVFFFGTDRIAKQLYDAAGIDAAEQIE